MKKMYFFLFLFLLCADIVFCDELTLYSPDFIKEVKPNGNCRIEERHAFSELVICNEKSGTRYIGFPLEPQLLAGKEITLSGEVAYENISPVPQIWQGVKLMLVITEKSGHVEYVQPHTGTGTSDWRLLSRQYHVPEGIRKAELVLGLKDASGTVRFRNVRLTAASTAVPLVRQYTLTGTIGKDAAEYAPREKMRFSFLLTGDNDSPAGTLRIKRNGEDGILDEKNVPIRCGQPVFYETSTAKPGFVMVQAELLAPDGTPVKNVIYGLGASVAAETLKPGVPEPVDFDRFWERRLDELKKVPITLLEKKLFRQNASAEVYDVKIACIGNPVSGYLSIPRKAKEKSLPLEICFDGYSVQSAPLVSRPDTLILSINPHGIENGRESEYYKKLSKGKLEHYGFSEEENRSPESCYFLGMVLRAVRAVQFARTLPEWDGKTLELTGSSQGGFQAVAAAALTQSATACKIKIPWFCDLGGVQVGRVRGWRPNYTPALGYFDTVHFASRITCRTFVMGGLSDYICPPSGVRILYNNLRGPAELKMVQGLNHAFYASFRPGETAICSHQKNNEL